MNSITTGTLPPCPPTRVFHERLRPFTRFALLALVALVLSGCGRVPLFSSLTETEANEMMAILLERNIDCSKTAAKEQKWILRVRESDFSRAVELLKSRGYPRDTFVKIGDVFQKSGLVSSPTEERIRYMYALSQEIAETLTQIDGVMNARVHIVIPDNDPLATTLTPSSAAVFVRYRPGFDLESLTPQLKNLVTRSIEGLSYENVSLVLVPAVDAVPPPTFAPPATADGLDPLLLGAGLGAAVIALGVLLWFLPKRVNARALKPEVAS